MAKSATVKIANATIHPDSGPIGKTDKPKSIGEDWDAKDHLRTLVDAHEVMNNPEKMKKVKKLIAHHKKTFKSIDEVKAYRQEKYGGVGGKPMANDHDGDEGMGE